MSLLTEVTGVAVVSYGAHIEVGKGARKAVLEATSPSRPVSPGVQSACVRAGAELNVSLGLHPVCLVLHVARATR